MVTAIISYLRDLIPTHLRSEHKGPVCPIFKDLDVHDEAANAKLAANYEGREYTHCPPCKNGKSDLDILINVFGMKEEDIRDIHHHVLFFANSNGKFTVRSINAGFLALGLKSNWVAAAATKAGFASLGCTNIHEALNLFHLPATRIYYQDGPNKGNLDEERFAEICEKYAPEGIFNHDSVDRMVQDIKGECAPEVRSLAGLVALLKYKLESIPFGQEYANLPLITETPGTIKVEELRQVLTSSDLFREAAERHANASRSSSTAEVEYA